jgi:hypothetical protein
MNASRFYLTVEPDPESGTLIAIISQGHPQRGDEEVTVCDVRRVQPYSGAEAWFKKQCITRPWEKR